MLIPISFEQISLNVSTGKWNNDPYANFICCILLLIMSNVFLSRGWSLGQNRSLICEDCQRVFDVRYVIFTYLHKFLSFESCQNLRFLSLISFNCSLISFFYIRFFLFQCNFYLFSHQFIKIPAVQNDGRSLWRRGQSSILGLLSWIQPATHNAMH